MTAADEDAAGSRAGAGPDSATPRRPDWSAMAIAVILLGIAALVAWDAWTLKLSPTYARVGPATAPYVVAALLAALAVGTAVMAVRGGFPAREHAEVSPILWIAGGLAVQMLVLGTAGFSIATGLMFAAAARGFGQRPLWLSFLIGTGIAFVAWVVFAMGLRLSLPAGPLERLLF